MYTQLKVVLIFKKWSQWHMKWYKIYVRILLNTWWRHQLETISAFLVLCAGNSPVPGEFPHTGQWRGALMFSLICARINGWVNNGEAGDLRGHWAHYDVIVMIYYNNKFLYLVPPSVRLKAGFQASNITYLISTCFRSHYHTIAAHTVMWQSHPIYIYIYIYIYLITMSAFLLLY